jgi:hypothetical protein
MKTVGGYGNLAGDNPGETRKGWAKRIRAQVALIRSMQVDWFIALELHDNYRLLMDPLGSDYTLHEGRGGNQLIVRKASGLTLRGTENFSLGGGKQSRSASWWRVTQNGQNFSLLGAHLISETVYLPQKIIQAKTLAKFCTDHKIMRGICGVDMNSSSAAPGLPRSILRSAGWGGLRYKNDHVVNAHLASGVHSGDKKPGQLGPWIDDLLSAPWVTVVEAAGVPTHGASDHGLWLKGTFDVKDS